ncbi:MAG: InlB B-repeat-containing protein [Lachnospiraceae bacterium]|nr:InlB B-repeat-containing protein [Lachnospiraceae bacterium]
MKTGFVTKRLLAMLTALTLVSAEFGGMATPALSAELTDSSLTEDTISEETIFTEEQTGENDPAYDTADVIGEDENTGEAEEDQVLEEETSSEEISSEGISLEEISPENPELSEETAEPEDAVNDAVQDPAVIFTTEDAEDPGNSISGEPLPVGSGFTTSSGSVVCLGAGILSEGVNTTNAAKVLFGYPNWRWRVIGYGGNGIASSAGSSDGRPATATLLMDDINYSARAYFDHEAPYSNVYAGSSLQKATNDLQGYLSSGEKAAIVPRKLTVNDTPGANCDGIAGEEVDGALFWSLSTKEALALGAGLGNASGEWWLRSPGSSPDKAAYHNGTGGVQIDGASVDTNYAVRPAFNLDLSSVVYTMKRGTEDVCCLYMLDPSVKAGSDGFSREGNTITVSYRRSSSLDRLNVLITDKVYTDPSAQILDYGKLAVAGSIDSNNKGTYDLPDDLSGVEGKDYHIYLIPEKSSHGTEYHVGLPIEIVESYPVWVGETQVTKNNKDDIPGIKGGGKASYDPDTNTLTFSGNVTGVTGYHAVSNGTFDANCQIYSLISDPALTIEGDARLHNEEVGHGQGIKCRKLIINGNLDILADDDSIACGPCTIRGKVTAGSLVDCGKLLIDGGTLKVRNSQVDCSEIEVKTGILDVEDSRYGGDKGVVSCDSGSITLSDQVRLIEPVGGSISTDGKYILEADGTTKAKKVLIGSADGIVTVTYFGKYASPIASQNIARGKCAIRPKDPTDPAGIFDGWYTTAACTEPFDFNNPLTKDTEVYSKWRSSKSFSIYYDVNGHAADWAGFGESRKIAPGIFRWGIIEGQNTINPGNNTFDYANPSDPEFRFDGWYLDAECTQLYDFNMVPKNDFTLYAGWTAPSVANWTVTFDLGEMTGKTPVVPPRKVPSGEKVKEPSKPMPPAGELKAFSGWFEDTECMNPYSFDAPVTEDKTLHAGWTDADGFSVYFADEAYDEDALTWNEYQNRFEHVYTGRAIRPLVIVTDVNGKALKEDVDYTLKYGNNKNVDKKGKPATITVKGKGNYKKTRKLTFYILPKDLNEGTDPAPGIEVEKTNFTNQIVVTAGKTPAPVIRYGDYRLSAKDYTLTLGNGKKKFSSKDSEDKLWITVKGKGNFRGMLENMPVTVRESNDECALKLKTPKKIKFTYDGTEKTLTGEQLKVYNGKGALLEKDVHYTVAYVNNVNAGTATVVVTGIGSYYQGLSAAKTFTIAPDKKSSKITASILTPADEITYDRTGVRPQILVEAERSGEKTALTEGVDYKVSYSNNKNAGKNAKYKITFRGNYKGRSAKSGKFTIRPASFGNNFLVIGGDQLYKKPGKYTSKIYVIDQNANNRLLSAKDYSIVSYVTESDGKNITKAKKYKLSSKSEYVNVTIKGKGNYEGTEKMFKYVYRIMQTDEAVVDLSKVKICAKGTQKALKDCEYSGESITPDIDVYIKKKGKWELLGSGKSSKYHYAYYCNNEDRGTGTVILMPERWYNDPPYSYGLKTATFKIKERGISGFLQKFWK